MLPLPDLPQAPAPAAPTQCQSPGACAGLHLGLPWTGQGMQGQEQSSLKSSFDTQQGRLKAPFLCLLQPGAAGPPPAPQDPRRSLLDPAFSPHGPQRSYWELSSGSSSSMQHICSLSSFARHCPARGGKGGGYTYSYFHVFPVKASGCLPCFTLSSTRCVVGMGEETDQTHSLSFSSLLCLALTARTSFSRAEKGKGTSCWST